MERKLKNGNIAFIIERHVIETFHVIAKSKEEAKEKSMFGNPYEMNSSIKKIVVKKNPDQSV